jgi:uncharacterized protein (TIGR02646 family)
LLKVEKTNEPDFFEKLKNSHKFENWEDYKYHPIIKEKLKEHMISYEQSGCCPYCEIKIEANLSEIEHIKPKSKFPNLFQKYSNLLAVCNKCGSHKGDQWDDLFIDPTKDDPNLYMTHEIETGKLIPIEYTENNKRAVITIEILNLNSKALCNMRKKFISEIKKLLKRDKNNLQYLDFFKEFPSLVQILKENLQYIV